MGRVPGGFPSRLRTAIESRLSPDKLLNMPKISIALATYNGAAFVREQLESFAGQARLPDELVVCDDGSSDATIAILEDFRSAARFPVRIHRNDATLGYVGNFERALSLCSGDIIFLSDQDDVWFSDKIERVVAEFEDRPDAMVVLNDQVIAGPDLNPTGTTKLANIRRSGAPDYRFVTGCCSAHRRQWLSVVLPIPAIGCSHDRWINEIAHRLGVAHILPVPLQLYRRHGENVSQSLFSSASQPGRLSRTAARVSDAVRPVRPIAVVTPEWEEAVVARLVERRPELATLGLAKAAESAILDLEAQLQLYRARQRIWSLPRVKRLAPIGDLWRSRAYDRMSGWKSAIGDLIRTRAEQ